MWNEQLKNTFPGLIHPIRVARWLSYQYQFPGTAWRIQNAAKGAVMAGPFKGLRIPAWQHRSYSELLGAFEHDIAPVIEDVIERKPQKIINVGSAYGYYALGLARRLPEASILAYEIDETRVRLVRKFAAINAVSKQIEFRSECTAAKLAADVDEHPRAFVLMDIEGGEASVLSRSVVPHFARAELLVEIHEMFVPGVTAMLQDRFATTHSQRVIVESPVSVASLDLRAWGLDDLDRNALAEILDDLRGQQMAWLHLTPFD